jgi:putative selenium metabolism protein SsnA
MFIKNAKIITFDDQDRIIEDGGIIINDSGEIIKVGTTKELEKMSLSGEVIDAKNHLLMPGNICAHTHFYGAYSRGMYIPGDAPNAFPEILDKLWWKLDKSLDEEAIYYSSLVCLIDAVKQGTTTLFDHHASPNYIKNSLDIISNAVLESGVRASLCYEVTDRDGSVKAEEGIDENLRFIDKINNDKENNKILSASFGLHASLTLSEKTLKIAIEKCPDDTGFHIHAAEHIVDEYDSIKKCGMRVVERLEKFNILGPKSILAHGVHIDVNEVNLISTSGTWLTHQPRSNMNNAVGLPNVESMLNAGVKFCLGNDGFSNSMWAEWKAASLGHKLYNSDPRRMPANIIQEMAIVNNRALVETLFTGLKIGKIAEGYTADLILVDYQPFTELNKNNLPWHIVFGFRDGMVTTTIVNGKIIMKNRKLALLDEEEIIKEAKKVSAFVWKRYHDSF